MQEKQKNADKQNPPSAQKSLHKDWLGDSAFIDNLQERSFGTYNAQY